MLVRKGRLTSASVSVESPVVVFQHRVVLPDGRVAWHHWSHRALFDREGKVSAGSSDNFYSPDRKKNREHVVQDPELSRLVATYVTRRIGPELAKAFAWDRPYRLESFIVLGYSDDRQDFFGRHRDRYLPEHPRRFAMSLNLNDGYEGGELRFPEYSDTLYVPPKGGVCIFSCSLLHEALPVTRGRRLTMTTFFLTAEPPAAPGPGAR